MKRMARVKLNARPETGDLLFQTMEAANALCDWMSQQAWASRKFRRYDIHNTIYHTVRQETNLAAQMIVRCIAKVADSYQKARDTLRTFKPARAKLTIINPVPDDAKPAHPRASTALSR